jgi:hypothetical protein
VKEGKLMFDDKYWKKALLLSINDHLRNYMEISFAGQRSPDTLEKMRGRKNAILNFWDTDMKCPIFR